MENVLEKTKKAWIWRRIVKNTKIGLIFFSGNLCENFQKQEKFIEKLKLFNFLESSLKIL